MILPRLYEKLNSSPWLNRLLARTSSRSPVCVPFGMLALVTPVNCGKGSTACCTLVVPLNRLVPASSAAPAKGLLTEFVHRLVLATHCSRCANEIAFTFWLWLSWCVRLPT